MATVMPAKRSLVAVDTNVLMDMADGHAPTLSAIEACTKRPQLALVATPTVVQELSYGANHWEPPERRAMAEKALTSMLAWGIRPINFIPAGHAICESVGHALARNGYLPEEEKNDGLVLAEAALSEASILLTWDEHLLAIPADRLAVFLREAQVAHVLIVSPAKINSLFG